MNLKDFDSLTTENPSAEIKAKALLNDKLPTIRADYTIRSCIEVLKINSMSGVAVVDDNNTLIGYVSEFDLLLQASSKDVNEQVSFIDNVISINEETSLKDTLLIMIKNKLKMIPVTDQRIKYCGVVSRIDLLEALTKL